LPLCEKFAFSKNIVSLEPAAAAGALDHWGLCMNVGLGVGVRVGVGVAVGVWQLSRTAATAT